MDVILSSVKWQHTLFNLENAVFFSNTASRHIENVRSVLPLWRDGSVALKIKNCESSTSFFKYLGEVIMPRHLEIASHTFGTIRNLKPPIMAIEPRYFIRLCNVSRRFVPHLARVAAPINRKLWRAHPARLGQLTEEETTATTARNDKLISPLKLALPSRDGKYSLDLKA